MARRLPDVVDSLAGGRGEGARQFGPEVKVPKVFRSMKADRDGFPLVEASASGLGVREPDGDRQADVDVDAVRDVIRNGKGMSVAPGWRALPPHRIPKRLRDRASEARGSTDLFCFTMGEGPFETSTVDNRLELIRDRPTHGVIAPRFDGLLERLQADLAATRREWTVEED